MLETALGAVLVEGFLQVRIPASHCIMLRVSYSAWLQHTKGGPAELPGRSQSHEMLLHFVTKSFKALLIDTPN